MVTHVSFSFFVSFSFSYKIINYSCVLVCVCVCVCVRAHVCVYACACAQLCPTLCDTMDSASLPMEFSRQEYWSGLPFPPPGDLPSPGMEPASLVSPALVGRFFTTVPPGKPPVNYDMWFF